LFVDGCCLVLGLIHLRRPDALGPHPPLIHLSRQHFHQPEKTAYPFKSPAIPSAGKNRLSI